METSDSDQVSIRKDCEMWTNVVTSVNINSLVETLMNKLQTQGVFIH